jgi:hypothetical protein
MVTIVVGNFRTNFQLTGSYAALIGALCGIAERSLAGRSDAGHSRQKFGGNPRTTT